jgi:hypothetical protein
VVIIPRPRFVTSPAFAPPIYLCYNDKSLGALREPEAMAKAVGAAPTVDTVLYEAAFKEMPLGCISVLWQKASSPGQDSG